MCNFISQQITTGSLPDSSSFLMKITNFITSDTHFAVSSRQHAEKEQTFLNLMEANALSVRFSFDELLEIAHRTKCYVVAQFILEKLKRYDKIIECFVLSNNSHELFRYIMENKNTDERKIYQQIYEHFQSILEIDCEKITKIIVEYYPICIPQFLKIIASIPRLHYNFLKSLVANNSELETSDYNTFLTLQCQYNPENVLEFLQNSIHTYDVHHAISVVEEKNLTSAMIFLYEKNSDYQKAFTLAMDLLRDAPESLAENHALKVSYLCMRASHVLNPVDRESYWFELIEVILARNYLSSIVKQVLHLASSSVDLMKLVKVIMRDNDNESNKSFGDIKHILIGMLSNFEYESLLLSTSQNILNRDLHKSLLKAKQSAEVGIFCKSLKCILCKRRLSDAVKAASEAKENGGNDQIIVFSICGHSMHNSCYQESLTISVSKPEGDISCNKCGIKILEKDSVYLSKTNWNLIAEDEVTVDLKLKAPTRAGLDNKPK